MARHGYLFVQSTDPFTSCEAAEDVALLAALAAGGAVVELVLVQNAVFATRKDAADTGIERLVRAGVRVRADAFSLRERGIRKDELRDRVAPCELDAVVAAMAAGARVAWL